MKIEKITKSPSRVEIIKKINELAENSKIGIIVSVHEEPIATESDLTLIENPGDGDIYFVSDTGYSYIYTGGEFKTFAPIVDILMPSDTELEEMWK